MVSDQWPVFSEMRFYWIQAVFRRSENMDTGSLERNRSRFGDRSYSIHPVDRLLEGSSATEHRDLIHMALLCSASMIIASLY